uniref:Uncharacterized protein n=1 Tax=Arundo donax TaxID=35708 RepID=A0A0A9HP13_ARUDO
MLRNVPSRRVSHGSGGASGCSRALERQGRQAALSRTRSAKEGSRLRTSPKSSGWRSDQDEDRAAFIMQDRKLRLMDACRIEEMRWEGSERNPRRD